MTLNDLKGGKATGTVYVDTGNGFEKAPYKEEYEPTFDYNPDDVTGDKWEGVWAPCPIDPPYEGGGIAGKAKIIFDITYPDGTTDTIETETRPVHNGYFQYANTEYGSEDGYNGYLPGEGSDPVTGDAFYTLSIDIIIDDKLVDDPDKVELKDNYSYLWYEDTGIYYYDPDIERFVDEDGKYHIIYTFYSDTMFNDGSYTFSDDMVYPEDKYNIWAPEDFYYEFVYGHVITDPSFISITQEHYSLYDDEVVDDFDEFYYDFKIELNDADTSLPITARLQSRAPGSQDWKDVDGYTLTFSGTDSTWTDQFIYDIYSVNIGDAIGVLNEMRVVCDYTLMNGEKGSIYSDDVSDIYSYKGEYLEGVSSEIDDGKLTASFRVDKDLVLDMSPSKLKIVQLNLWRGGQYRDIDNIANITGPDTDGIITIEYTLADYERDWDGVYDLILVLDYTDKNGKIDWESVAIEADIVPKHRAPVFTLDIFDGYPGKEAPPFADIISKLYDLEGGSAVAKLLIKNPEGKYETIINDDGDEMYTREYAGEEEWLYNTIVYETSSIYAVEWNDKDITFDSAMVVIDYTYPDGTTGHWESEEFILAFGDYVGNAEGVYDSENKTMTVTIPVWDEIDPAQITYAESHVRDGTPYGIDHELVSISGWTDDDGNNWLTVTIRFEDALGPQKYSFIPTFEYKLGTGVWGVDYAYPFTVE